MIRHIKKHAKHIEHKIDTMDVLEQGDLVSTLLAIMALGFILYHVMIF